ncbi:CLUMA_CG015097, isoform A [Clunio marinus]|uniref:COP9 signalosome complex subunit 3 n=1 Tax=Clunio marinus TaxID=568069 RepID=A0A1J1IPK9_9DIPT|nr:CLUMA_CG015097, isoform A [Clunio marinus]
MASALEHYVNNVRTLTSAGNFRELVEYLNDSTELLSKNSNILDNVLETLDVQLHSLGVLYILVAKISEITNEDPEPILSLVKKFVNICNGEQVRNATQTYFDLFHHFTNLLVKRKLNTTQGIQVLATAIEKIQLTESQLTPLHADLCQLCLCSKLFSPALHFLDIDITQISSSEENQDATTKYFLLYFYYGGMIYTAIKNYDRALYYFEVAISTPAMAMSHIMLESYKKYILVSLILRGKQITIPKYSSQVIGRFMKPLSQHYHELSNVYINNGTPDAVRAVMTKYQETFNRDNNMGLVKQVLATLYKKKIQRLTKTFLTLSLSDVASRACLSTPMEAEKYILNMIKSGEIFATINQKDGMVVFKDDPEKYNTPAMYLKIQEDMNNVIELNKKISAMEEEIMLTPMFVKKAIVPDANEDKNYVADVYE